MPGSKRALTSNPGPNKKQRVAPRCEHNMLKEFCKDCGGSQICEPGTNNEGADAKIARMRGREEGGSATRTGAKEVSVMSARRIYKIKLSTEYPRPGFRVNKQPNRTGHTLIVAHDQHMIRYPIPGGGIFWVVWID